MPYFGVTATEENFQYFLGLKERFKKQPGMMMFMYRTRITYLNKVWVVDVSPIFPKAYFLGVALLFFSYFLNTLIGWWALVGYIPAVLMLSTYLFWWPTTYKWLLKKSCRKKGGVLGEVITGENLLRVVFFGTNGDI